MTRRLVVVGGDAAGMSAAATARRRDRSLEIVAFERGEHTSYAACGIPYLLAGDLDEPEHLVARSPAEHRKRGIDLHTHHEVEAIDTTARTVTVRDLRTGDARTEHYDDLMLGTGSVAVRPAWPGVDADGVHTVKTLAGAIELQRRLTDRPPARAVVVGGGYIGVEVAEALVRRGIETALVDLAPAPMVTFDADMGARVAAALARAGVELHLGVVVEGIVIRDGAASGVIAGGEAVAGELVVLGIGVRPQTALARAAGVAVGATGGIVCDPRMRTSVTNVWAAGDCVESFHRVTEHMINVPLGTHANKQGVVAGTNIAGGYARFPGVIGTAITRFMDTEIARTGCNEREARDAGFDYVSVVTDTHTLPGYFPGHSPITVKLVAERYTARLLGGQIIGGPGAGKRIDTLATAIWNGMTVGDLMMSDLAYAPPFSPVWDPVQTAARQMIGSLARD